MTSSISNALNLLILDATFISEIVAYIMNVEIKDEDEALYYETNNSLDHYDKYSKIFYNIDTYPEIINLHNYLENIFVTESINTFNIHSLKVKITFDTSLTNDQRTVMLATLNEVVSFLSLETYIDLTFKNRYIEKYRLNFINNYVDLNPYYARLQAKYPNINIIKIRDAHHFEIIYEDINNATPLTLKFSFYYSIVHKTFMSTMYNKAFSRDMIISDTESYINYYNSYCKFSIVLMAIIELAHHSLKIPLDTNIIDVNILDQFLYSFGFDEFKNFPVQYKKSIVSNLNKLIQYKGTDKVLIDILSIFNLEDINIFKYYLIKHSTVNESKTFFPDVNLRFLAVPIDKNIHDSLKLDNLNNQDYKIINYEDVTLQDPTWLVSKEEVLSKSFDYINTKYISVDVSLNVIKDTYNFVYIQNTIRKLKNEFPNTLDVTVYADKLSQTAIPLEDMFSLLHVLILDYYKIEDFIDFSQNKIMNIYQFNSSNEVSYQNSILKEDSYLGSMFSLFDLTSDLDINKTKFEQIFGVNKSANENYNRYILDYQSKEIKYKALKDRLDLYKSKFYSTLNLDLYTGFTKYSDYLKIKNLDLYKYYQSSEVLVNSEDKVNKILYILDILIEYYKNIKLSVNAIVYNEISDYIIQTIKIFKSHLVTLDNLALRYKFDEQIFFKIIDEKYFNAEFSNNEYLMCEDDLLVTSTHTEKSKLKLIDFFYINYTIITKDVATIKDLFIRYSNLKEESRLHLEDYINLIVGNRQSSRLKMNDIITISVNNELDLIKEFLTLIDSIKFSNKCLFSVKNTYNDAIPMDDSISLYAYNKQNSTLALYDNIVITSL